MSQKSSRKNRENPIEFSSKISPSRKQREYSASQNHGGEIFLDIAFYINDRTPFLWRPLYDRIASIIIVINIIFVILATSVFLTLDNEEAQIQNLIQIQKTNLIRNFEKNIGRDNYSNPR